MNIESELSYIRNICLINFLEIRELRKKLNIADETLAEHSVYETEISSRLTDLHHRIHELLKELPVENQ